MPLQTFLCESHPHCRPFILNWKKKIKKNHAWTLNAGTDGLLVYEVSLKPNSWRIMIIDTPYKCRMKKKTNSSYYLWPLQRALTLDFNTTIYYWDFKFHLTFMESTFVGQTIFYIFASSTIVSKPGGITEHIANKTNRQKMICNLADSSILHTLYSNPSFC